MNVSTVAAVRYIIELNEAEALILRSMIQNPLCDNESPSVASFRGELFHKLAPPAGYTADSSMLDDHAEESFNVKLNRHVKSNRQ